MLDALPTQKRKRYEKLETQCTEVRLHACGREANPMEDHVFSGMNKLIWIFLNLLMSGHVLEANLGSTSREQLETEIKAYEAQLAKLGTDASKGRSAVPLQDPGDRPQANGKPGGGPGRADLRGRPADAHQQQMQLLKQEVALGKDSATLSASADAIARTLNTTQDWMRNNTDVFATGVHDDWDEAPQVLQRKVRA